ncbi:ABC transporter substrate-binding protein [Leptolyngbya sp. BC1307]|uniref:ABC transporter substrate-binding protein n=1 Tax=Leptolyngbya sp. BC1307 TaxID=2029589 RepID=UPI000EFAF33C|nr:ABC transporter substrate-binding protein [Leptolyngbya sp. BC1307]
MGKRNELPALVASLLITVALLGGGAWWLKNNFFSSEGSPSTGSAASSQNTSEAGNQPNQSILPGAVSASKQKGLETLAAGDYATAQTELTAALQAQRNDPEALIYLNNAKIGNGSAYTIAVPVPASKLVNPALEILRGVAQAQADINQAGGINGTPLKVILANDSGQPDTAAAVADQLVKNKDVLGVIGHYSSDTTLAAAKVYETGQLAMISPTSTAVKIADAGDYIFRTVPSDRLAAATLARYVLNTLNKKQAAVFYTSDSTYSQSIESEFTTELLSNGGEVVANFDISEAGFSAGKAVQMAKESGADVIMLALTADTAATSIQIMSVNQRELPVVGSDDLYDPKVLDVGREDALGLTIAVPWHILSHSQSPFVSESRQLWGGDVNWRTVMAYDATKTLAAGIQSDPTRAGVAAALASSGFSAEGATDTVSFFPSGDRNQTSQLVEVVPGNRSGSGYDFVPVQ